MPSRISNALLIFNATFSFCQWLCYLTLLEIIKSTGQQKMLLYCVILFQYAPMSLVPFLMRKKMERQISAPWFYWISGLGIVTSFLHLFSVYLHNMAVGITALFFMSSLLGMCMGLFIVLPAKLSENAHQLKLLQSRLLMGYYLGVLLVTTLYGLLMTPHRFLILGISGFVLQIINLVCFRSVFKHDLVTRHLTTKNQSETLSSLFKASVNVKAYLIMMASRYLAWGVIASLFPLAVLEYFSKSPKTFSWVSAAFMFSMMVTAYWLSVGKNKRVTANYRVSAGFMNAFNGVFVAIAYVAPSFNIFLTFFILAAIVSVVADVKTSSGFIGDSPLEIRGRLGALTSSVRFLFMAVGNILALFFVNVSWFLGPVVICILLVSAGICCFYILGNQKYDKSKSAELA